MAQKTEDSVKNKALLEYTYWQDEDMWIGYLDEFPDYLTQGETRDELKENLVDIYNELTSGHIQNPLLYSLSPAL